MPKHTHTPGPWTIECTGMGYNIRGDGNGHCVVFTNTASCSKAALRRNVSKDEEESANARLIAAAPDGLAFAESFIEWINQLRRSGVERKKMLPGLEAREHEAIAFIAKAKGDA